MSGFRSPHPHYDVLAKWDSPSWDDATREVVRKRLHGVPARTFLTAEEWAVLEAVCGRLVPQPDRPHDAVPIAPWIDRKLAQNSGDGYRLAEMPPMREAWRQGLCALDAEARRRHGSGFADLGAVQQDAVLRCVQQGDVTAPQWDGLPATRFFTDALLKTVVATYYAHPAAWSECGFGGPASPRGYVRLGSDERDRWEAEAQVDAARDHDGPEGRHE